MAEISLDQVDTSTVLQAAMTGNVGELKDLIRRDPNVLHKFSLSSFPETALHVSSLRGHLEFTKVLLKEKPDMAKEPSPKGYYPLHYASAEGHVEVVKALLKSSKEACESRAQDGKIPLHVAVIRDRVEVVELLVEANPSSIAVVLHGETVYHLCVRYNSVEPLKELVKRDHTDLATKANDDGNTIFHLDAILRHSESLKYIISVPKLNAKINAINKIRFSALDLLEYFCPKDFETLDVRNLLVDAGATRKQKRRDNSHPQELTKTAKESLKSFMNCIAFDWIEEARGSLMIVATVIAQMTYQSALNPPGGVWEENFSKANMTIAGSAVMAASWPDEYYLFLKVNAAGLTASLGIILLIIAGFPIGNKYFLLAFTLAMCASISSLVYMYLLAIDLLSDSLSIQFATYKVWLVLLGVTGVVYSLRIFRWIAPRLIKLKTRLLKKFGEDPPNSSTTELQIA